MEINIKTLLSGEEKLIALNFSLPLNYQNGDSLLKDAAVVGKIESNGGYIHLDAEIVATLITNCARCLTPLSEKCSTTFNRMIAHELQQEDEEDEYIVPIDGKIDITNALCEELILAVPQRSLCDDACKGICPKCGVNLNEKSCSCVHSEKDPRWNVLKNLFKDSDNDR